jgi:outer membrane protein assembly factor BamB
MGGGKPPDVVYCWEVYCLGRADGKVLWKRVAAEHKPTYPINPSNTYASETPATDGERVYAYFGMTGLFCYDLDGKPLWSKEPGTFKMMLGFGTGSSPALDAERLYVQCDNEEKSFLAALDKRTGKELWRADRKEKSSWSTPFVWKNKVRTEVVACGGGGFGGKGRVVSYDPRTGAELWHLGGIDGGFNASPVASEELLYFGTGGPRGDSPLFAVKAGAAGDISPKEGESSGAGVAWRRKQAGPYTSSPLLYEGYLYVVGQRGGLLSCYEAATGKPAYEKARLPGAKGFTASPWAYDGKVFLLDESGKTFVVRAGPEFKLLNTNSLDEMFWSSPAVSGGCLFLRGVDHLYCVKSK